MNADDLERVFADCEQIAEAAAAEARQHEIAARRAGVRESLAWLRRRYLANTTPIPDNDANDPLRGIRADAARLLGGQL